MDDRQLAELREWGRRLKKYGESPELRAAGRALDLATAEIERLRSQLAPPAPRDEARRPPAAARRRRRPLGVDEEADEEGAEPLTRLPERLLERAAAVVDPPNSGQSRQSRRATTAVIELPPAPRPRPADIPRRPPDSPRDAAAERAERRRARARPAPAWTRPRNADRRGRGGNRPRCRLGGRPHRRA
jgi:hypothetical protein